MKGGDEQVEFQEEEPEQDLHAAEIMLRRFHANLGHPSKGLMLRLLCDANAPLETHTAARIFHCPHCVLMVRRTGAVRPVQVSRSKELGHTISTDACHLKRNRDGREAIIVNIVGGASRFHGALVLKEGGPEDELPDASIDELVEHCVAAKVRRQTLDGYSPLQGWFGTQRAREVEEQGLGDNRSSFERRLQFQTAAQTACVRADARKTLRMASMRDHVY